MSQTTKQEATLPLVSATSLPARSSHADTATAGRTLVGVQVLRGIAAMLVVFHHYVGTSVERGFAIHGLEGAAVGNAGVDIFFVISGFIMEYTVGARSYRQGDRIVFMARRIIRIVPLYWVLTILAFAAAMMLKGAVNSRPTWEQFFLSMALLPGVDGAGHSGYVIPMAWTLAYEFYFYAIFCLLLGTGARMRLLLLAAIFAPAVVVELMHVRTNAIAGIMLNPLLLEFLAGCILAQLVRSGRSVGALAGATLIAIGLGAFVLELKVETTDSIVRLVLWGVPAILLVYGTVLGRASVRAMWTRAFEHVGDISYSLYLSHFFSIALFVKLYGKLSGASAIPPWLVGIGLFAVCLLVAQICYVLIERPSRIALQRIFNAARLQREQGNV